MAWGGRAHNLDHDDRSRQCVRANIIGVLALGWTLLCASPVSSQQVHRVTWDVGVGPSLFDIGGFVEDSRRTGVALSLVSRLSYPVNRQLIVEAAFTYVEDDAADRSLVPELGLQMAFPVKQWWPYVGVGGGFQQILEDGGGSNGTVHVVTGVRARLARHFGLRAEARGRVIVPSSGMADLTFGGGWTF